MLTVVSWWGNPKIIVKKSRYNKCAVGNRSPEGCKGGSVGANSGELGGL